MYPRRNPGVGAGRPRGGPAGCADGLCDEIFAWGFRNPFRISFDKWSRALFAADVGQLTIEEVDVVVRGGNYGWNVKEGSFCYHPNGTGIGFITAETDCGPPGIIDPVAEYDHSEGRAVIGGFVYRGRDIPWLRGRYIFGDYTSTFPIPSSRLFYLERRHWLLVWWKTLLGFPVAKSEIHELPIEGLEDPGIFLMGFGQDARGEVYLLGNLRGTPFGSTGVVMRLAP